MDNRYEEKTPVRLYYDTSRISKARSEDVRNDPEVSKKIYIIRNYRSSTVLEDN